MPTEENVIKAREILATDPTQQEAVLAAALDAAEGIEPEPVFDRAAIAAGLASARDAGNILPWEEMSRGFGTRTYGRSLKGHEDEYIMVVRGKRYAVGWSILGLTNPSLILAAGVFRADAADENYTLAMNVADEALARINPNDLTTCTAVLSDEDHGLLQHRELIVAGETFL